MALFGKNNDEDENITGSYSGYDDEDDFDYGDDDDDLDNLTLTDDYDDEEDVDDGKRSLAAPIAVMVFVALAAAGGIWYAFFRGDNNNQNTTAEQPTTSENFDYGGNNNQDPDTDGVTVAESVGVKHSGSQKGNRDNGTSVILGFNYAYYVERSGEKAIKYYNPNNLEYDKDYIQKHIDEVPEGTRYNLEITPVVIGKDYEVRLYLQLPGTSPVVYDQRYTIAKGQDGKYYFEQFTSEQVKSE